MRFVSYPPPERLRPYVRYFAISENSDEATYKVLPDTCLVMGFQYSGKLAYIDQRQEVPLAQAGITGLRSNYRLFKNSAGIGTVLVIFNETGAAHFLTHPVHELFGESLSLDHFFTRSALEVTADKLNTAATDHQRLAVIGQLLLDHLQEYRDDLMVIEAIRLINDSKGSIRITELAEKLNISQSPLDKRFRKVVGSSPKKFASIVRMKNVMAALTRYNFRETIFITGYYDQAHLIHDFKTFTGLTPQEYQKEQSQK